MSLVKLTHSPLVVLLYEDWIGEPVRVECLSDEASSEKPVDLIVESLARLIHLPQLLFHWLDPVVDGESVADDGRVNARHVGRSPCKLVQVVGEELFEHDLLIGGKPRPNPESSFQMQEVCME